MEEPDPLEETVSEIQDRDVPLHELQEAWPRWLEQVKTGLRPARFLQYQSHQTAGRARSHHTTRVPGRAHPPVNPAERTTADRVFRESTVGIIVHRGHRQQGASPKTTTIPTRSSKKYSRPTRKSVPIVDIFGAELGLLTFAAGSAAVSPSKNLNPSAGRLRQAVTTRTVGRLLSAPPSI